MTMRARRTLIAVGCALVLSACGGSGDDATAGDDGATGAAPPEGATEASFIALDVLDDEVQAAIADAARRFDVPEAEVAVAGALDVVWADGSLGCPEDDTLYTQALVDGYLLTLEVEGRRLAYHGEDGLPPFLCER
jgi:ABC-type glycerol-3-phosphate transport system substrate-binding protein